MKTSDELLTNIMQNAMLLCAVLEDHRLLHHDGTDQLATVDTLLRAVLKGTCDAVSARTWENVRRTASLLREVRENAGETL